MSTVYLRIMISDNPEKQRDKIKNYFLQQQQWTIYKQIWHEKRIAVLSNFVKKIMEDPLAKIYQLETVTNTCYS